MRKRFNPEMPTSKPGGCIAQPPPVPPSNPYEELAKKFTAEYAPVPRIRVIPANSRVVIGDYCIEAHAKKGCIWLYHKSGEGGEFSEKKLAAAIEKFYKENF